MTVTARTTLVELEGILAALGLVLVAELDGAGRFQVTITDGDGYVVTIIDSTLYGAIECALANYARRGLEAAGVMP